MVLPELKNAVSEPAFGAVDALAALAENGDMLISIVHRGSAGPIHMSVILDDFRAAGSVEWWMLTAEKPWGGNSLAAPRSVRPVSSKAAVMENKFELDIAPYTVLRAWIGREP